MKKTICLILALVISDFGFSQCIGTNSVGTHNSCFNNISNTLTVAGTSNLGTVASGTWNGTVIGITKGGSGQATANDALNAFLPTQSGNSGKILTTDGTNTSWIVINQVKIGVVEMYAGSMAPSGYLLCDGSAVSRTTYADLFSVIGVTFGVGDGSTTFNLPNVQQKFPLGKAASGTGSTLGETGGNIDHSHSIDPGTTATTSAGSHNHTGVTGTPSATVQATILVGGAASTDHTHTISTDGDHTHSVDITSFNSASANPPYIVLNFIIKY